MCQQQAQSHSNSTIAQKKMKPTYSIKKILKILFKKQQHDLIVRKSSSLESLDNMRNTEMEENFYAEIGENFANEKLVNIVAADTEQIADIYVPVRFARTDAGTFFWTTNLQPVASTITPAGDEDLVQPAYCYSTQYQWPSCAYSQDRWAQA